MTFKFIPVIMFSLLLGACDADDGKAGVTGAAGATGEQGPQGLAGAVGETGAAGINCWDSNTNNINDVGEDINGDGVWNTLDCRTTITDTQSPEVVFNHQHMCEAFANLMQYPEGCPSASHSVPTGTITQIFPAQLFDDGTGTGGYTSCTATPGDGLLTINMRDVVNSEGNDEKHAYYELEGAYIAADIIMSKNAVILDGACKARCENDSKCIGSNAIQKTSEAMSCRIFYHSDSVSKYERLCAIAPSAALAGEICQLGLGNANRWTAKCP